MGSICMCTPLIKNMRPAGRFQVFYDEINSQKQRKRCNEGQTRREEKGKKKKKRRRKRIKGKKKKKDKSKKKIKKIKEQRESNRTGKQNGSLTVHENIKLHVTDPDFIGQLKPPSSLVQW